MAHNSVGFNTDAENGYSPESLIQDLPSIETENPDLIESIVELVYGAAQAGDPIALAGGHGYERKGWLSVDYLGADRNFDSSYVSKSDDVLLQLTVRVPFKAAEEIVTALASERIERDEREAQAQRDALDLEIARLQAQRAAL